MKFNLLSIISFVFLIISGTNATLNNNEKKLLLYSHKQTRKNVNASNMRSLSWDTNLANKAEKYAKQCKYNKREKRFIHGSTGENLAWGTIKDINRFYKLWENEKANFEASGVVSKFKLLGSKMIGHYSQIVWANNSKVGCGLNYCKNAKSYLLVCRYETGNILGQKVYEKGKNNQPVLNVSTDGAYCSKYGYCETSNKPSGKRFKKIFGILSKKMK